MDAGAFALFASLPALLVAALLLLLARGLGRDLGVGHVEQILLEGTAAFRHGAATESGHQLGERIRLVVSLLTLLLGLLVKALDKYTYIYTAKIDVFAYTLKFTLTAHI